MKYEAYKNVSLHFRLVSEFDKINKIQNKEKNNTNMTSLRQPISIIGQFIDAISIY